MKKYLSISFILLTFSTFAQDTNQALVNLVQQALTNSARLKEQQILLTTGDARRAILKSNEKPQVSAEASYSRVDPVGAFAIPLPGFEGTVKFLPNNNYATNGVVNYVIYDWGRNKANIEKILLEMEQNKMGLEGLKNALAYQVAQLYYGVVYLQKAIKVQEDQVKLIEQNAKIINNRIKNGDDIDYNLIQTQVRGKNAETRVIDLKGQLERQYIFLGNLIGGDAHSLIPTNAELKITFAEISAEAAFDQAVTNSWDLKGLQQKEVVLQKDNSITALSLRPTLGSSATVGFKNGIQPDIDQFRFNWAGGVKFSMPIYNGKRASLQKQLTDIQIDANRQAIQSTTQQLRRDLASAQNDLNTAQLKYQLAARNVYQAEYGLKLARVRLENGVSIPLEIEQAEAGIEQARFDQLQYEYQQIQAKLEINRLISNKFW
ncbi:MAG: TolC family protein [Spirosomataceae bacterium]